MSKIILFSEPVDQVMKHIAPELFVTHNMTVAYMPSDGANKDNPKYQTFWEKYVSGNGAKLIPIDNSRRGKSAESEKKRLIESDALILTGGNTFQFLYHLKQSGLDTAIKEYSDMNKIIAGFSAGAIILSPTIEIAQLPTLDENNIGISDLSALNLVNFDIFPHYDKIEHELIVKKYENQTGRSVCRLANDEYIVTKTA